VIAVVGEGWCFLVDGISYFAVIASLLLMRIKPMDLCRKAGSMLEQMREGWDYVRTFRPIRTILLLLSLLGLMGNSWSVLVPIFANQVLHGGAGRVPTSHFMHVQRLEVASSLYLQVVR
jgi:Transmembrane secretion effector